MEWYCVCWPRLTAKRVAPVVSISWASCYIRSGQVQPQWFSGTKPDWWVGKHIVVDWAVSVELYLLYENISCGFTLQVSRCNVVQCLFVVFQLQCIVSLALCSFFNTIGPTFGGSSSESSTSIATCNRWNDGRKIKLHCGCRPMLLDSCRKLSTVRFRGAFRSVDPRCRLDVGNRNRISEVQSSYHCGRCRRCCCSCCSCVLALWAQRATQSPQTPSREWVP